MREINRILLIIIFVLMLPSLFPLSGNAAGISIGMETRVPPFVWKDALAMEDFPGLTADQKIMWKSVEAEIAEYRNWGAQWNVITVDQWSSGPGQLLWLRRVIETHQKNGLDVALRLMEDPSVYGNFTQTESAEYGYNKKYYEWVKSIAQTFGRLAIYYFIGNETELGVHGERSGPGEPRTLVTYEQYRKLLVTAIKAIKSVDAKLMVANCGFSDYPLALAAMDDINRRQGLVDAQAFWAKWKKSGGKPVEGLPGVYRLLRTAETERIIAFVKQAIRDPAGSDVLQLHYYGGWEALPILLQWVNQQMQESRSVRPIVAAEVGYYVRSRLVQEGSKSYWQMDMNGYSPTEHAEQTVKDFTLLLGAGVQHALYWHMRARDNKAMVAALFEPTRNPAEFTPTQAANAFRMLANTLNGLSAAAPRLADTKGLWHFHFTGARDVTLAWAEHPLQMTLPPGVREVRDMSGNPIQRDTQLTIDSRPVYLLWGTASPPH